MKCLLFFILICIYSANAKAQNNTLKERVEKGDTAAIYLLAENYWSGKDGMPRSLSKAAFLYKKGALLGHSPSALGYFVYCRNFSKDIYEGMKYLTMAAESGYAESEYVLGMTYWEDLLVAKDLSKADYWIQKSITDGCNRGIRPLQKVKYELQQNLQKETTRMKITSGEENSHKTYVDSDVDKDIYTVPCSNNKTFAIVIANEKYENVPNVPFAYHDGETVIKYCHLTLGIPEENIRFVRDASRNDIRFHVNWAKKMMQSYDGEAQLIFYYAGHGIPNELTKEAYILPVDGIGNDVSTAYSLKDLYKILNQLPSRATVVFLDACFSGTTRDQNILQQTRGVAIKVKDSQPVGSLVVISAAADDQTAAPYESVSHGMFTYYLLKKLQESKGEVSVGDLFEYVSKQVKKSSLIENGKLQTPTITVSSYVNGWENWKLK